MIYDLARYIRDTVTFPNDMDGEPFDPETQVIVGGYLPDDTNDIVLIRENSGIASGEMDDRIDTPFQFLARGRTHGYSRDLIYAIFDAESLTTVTASGDRFHFRSNFLLAPTGKICRKFSWIQTPHDLGSEDGGYIHSANCLIVSGAQ